MPGKRFSQITPSAANLVTGDSIVGVTAAGNDVLFSRTQANIIDILTTTTTFYVSTTGSDTTGDGSIANPWATPQHAYDVLVRYDLRGFTAIIRMADGTYFNRVTMDVPNTTGSITFVGTTAIATIIGGFSFNPTADDDVTFTGLSVNVLDGRAAFEILGQRTKVSFSGNIYISNTSLAIIGQGGALINLGGTFHIDNTVLNFIQAFEALFLVPNSCTITITGTPAWSVAMVSINDLGMLHNYGVFTINGTATGKRFVVADGGVIQTGSNNLSFFPGNVAGEIGVGGQYDNIASNSSGPFIVSTLPPVASVPVGQRAWVTDSNATLAAGLGNVVVGLGGNGVPVTSTGAAWIIG